MEISWEYVGNMLEVIVITGSWKYHLEANAGNTLEINVGNKCWKYVGSYLGNMMEVPERWLGNIMESANKNGLH